MEQGRLFNVVRRIIQNANPAPNDVVEYAGAEQRVQLPAFSDTYLPAANVVRIMRQILPPYAKIADDSKEIFQLCLTEYIGFITSEANDVCRKDKRKTLTADDTLAAMVNLGFDDYVGPLTRYLERYRSLTKGSSSSAGESSAANKSAADLGPTIEPLPAHVAPGFGPIAELPPTPSAFNYGPSFALGPNMRVGFSDPMDMGWFYQGGSSSGGAGPSGGSSSQGQDEFAESDLMAYLGNLGNQ
ncbi:hypothetical protein L6164_029516 [Bauhinia variegata]|uniref:Uncharacterized protein n=1 Tax=Bauhinia variegata TaxID=167791 RepID=A0ACB9LAU7_BAUVA|nr:hypothetical protein L6164_029516 [Bauhinia variegata]